MTRWRRLPLRVQLVVVATGLVVLALLATGFASHTALSRYLMDRTDGQLMASARAIAHDRSPGFGGTNGPDDGRGPFQRPAYYVQVSLADGSVTQATIFTSVDVGDPGQPDLPRITSADVQSRGGQPFTVHGVGGGADWRAVALPLSPSGNLVVAVSLADVDRILGRLDLVLLLVGLAVLAAMVGVGYLAVTKSLRPLREVEDTAAAIAGGDLSRRVPEQEPTTEVGRLAVAFNQMLARIEEAFADRSRSEAAARSSEERMRRFVADASHELRTPLTSIRGFAELYRQGAVSDPEHLRRVMRRVEEEATRMGLLVEDLLLLARLDQERPIEQHPVDLLALARDAVHDARAVDPDREISLHADGQAAGPPVVVGDEPRLRQVIGNLMSNALTHTPPGTPVEVRVRTTNEDGTGWAVLSVVDHGPGLAEEQAGRIFERFYRADTSRTRASGGTGLGLSIVAALVAAHGGHVEVDAQPGEGAVFHVRLPLTAAVEPEQQEEPEESADESAEPDEPAEPKQPAEPEQSAQPDKPAEPEPADTQR